MFCVQCEQTIRTPAGNGCSYAQGMCGKTSETSDLQDVLIYMLQGVSWYAERAREFGAINADVDAFIPRAFFATLTNVNFDNDRIVELIREANTARDLLKTAYVRVNDASLEVITHGARELSNIHAAGSEDAEPVVTHKVLVRLQLRVAVSRQHFTIGCKMLMPLPSVCFSSSSRSIRS